MVHLGVKSRLTALQPIDDEELPQRTTAVEQRRMQARHVLLQLAVGARLGQRDVPHVVVDVHVFLFDPDWIREVERHQRELAGEHVCQMDATGHESLGVLVEIALVARRQIEHVERTHMHRHFWGFKVQEGGVEAAQVFHVVSLIARSKAFIRIPCRHSKKGLAASVFPPGRLRLLHTRG